MKIESEEKMPDENKNDDNKNDKEESKNKSDEVQAVEEKENLKREKVEEAKKPVVNKDESSIEKESRKEPETKGDEKDLERRIVKIEERERKVNLMEAARKANMNLKYVKYIEKSARWNENNELENGDQFFEDLKKEAPEFFEDEGGEEPKKEVLKTDKSGTRIDKGQHIFTREEIDKMSREEYKKNREKIIEQESKGLIK